MIPCSLNNRIVISPSWFGDVDSCWNVSLYELESNPQCSSASYGLRGNDSSLGLEGIIPSEHKQLAELIEFGYSINWEIFLIL